MRTLASSLNKSLQRVSEQNSEERERSMEQIDNELECRARELLAYLDDEPEIEEALPFAVRFAVEQMRAARFARAWRAIAPAHRCRLYRH